MSIDTTNNLNYVLSLQLPLDKELEFFKELLALTKDRSLDETLSKMEIGTKDQNQVIRLRSIMLVGVLTSGAYKKTLKYELAKTAIERARVALESSSNQPLVDLIFDKRLALCKSVPKLERVLLDWEEEKKKKNEI